MNPIPPPIPLPTPTPDPAPDPSPDPDPTPEPMPDPSPEPDPEPSQGEQFFQTLDAYGIGRDLRQKFGDNAAAAFQSLIEGYKLVGQKNEEAALAKKLKERLGEDGVQALLNGQQPGTPESLEKLPREVFDALIKAASQPGAPEEVVALAEKARAQMYDSQGTVPREVQETIASLKHEVDSLKTALQEGRQTNAVDTFYASHRAELENPNGELTELGKSFAHEFRTNEECTDLDQGDPKRYRLAYKFAKFKIPKAKGTRPVKDTAKSEPSTAAPTLDETQMDKIFGEIDPNDPLGLDTFLRRTRELAGR